MFVADLATKSWTLRYLHRPNHSLALRILTSCFLVWVLDNGCRHGNNAIVFDILPLCVHLHLLLTELLDDLEAAYFKELHYVFLQELMRVPWVDDGADLSKQSVVLWFLVVQVQHCCKESLCLLEREPIVLLLVELVEELFDILHPVTHVLLLKLFISIFEIIENDS